MKKAIKFAMLSLTLATVLPFATAAPPKPTMCPVCHMPLSMKKTKADPVAVRLKPGGKVMYCCSKCKMPASVLVKVHKMSKASK